VHTTTLSIYKNTSPSKGCKYQEPILERIKNGEQLIFVDAVIEFGKKRYIAG